MHFELQLSVDHLQYLASLFDALDTTHTFRPGVKQQKKVAASICIQVGAKVIKKFDGISQKTDLFNSKKRYKLTLMYHEAFAVLVLLRQQKEPDHWRKIMNYRIDSMIDKKL